MLPVRSILFLAFVLTGALTAAAQSPEPGQSATSATTQSTIEPNPTLSTPSQPNDATPAGEAAAKSDVAEPASEAGLSKREGVEAEPKDTETKSSETPPATAPGTAQSATGTAEPSNESAASDVTAGDKVFTPTAASEAANRSELNATTPDASIGNDASTAAREVPQSPQATPKASEAAAPEPQTPTSPEPPPAAPLPMLAVDTGGGAFAQAYKHVVLEPFAAETGIMVSDAPGDGKSGDLLLLDGSELARRCASGDLITLEIAGLNPSTTATAAPDDYLEGALKPCGIAALAWSNLFVYDPAKFEKRAPRTAADVFDTRRYPGKRALPRDGRGLVESLLVADGVAPSDVYKVLETSDGINRILKRLKSLGTNIVWYDRLSEAIALVREGKATIAFTSNGHAFIEQARGGPLGLIWDGQVLHASYFAIPKSAPDQANAKQLVAFSSRPEQLAALVRQIPYGPMRRSAIAGALGVRHTVTGQELGPYLPTAPENMRTAVRFDAVWWEANSERIETALGIARQGPPIPARP